MPEGDTIWRTAQTLHEALAGKVVNTARPDTLKRFQGRTVTEVTPVGKHLLIRFDNGLAIHSHMRMRGAWHVYRKGERWRRPTWQAKALLETDEAVAVCFEAPVIDLVKDETKKLGHLGPDILTDDWKVDEVVSRARVQALKPIGELLLDQRVTSGIGNIHRCEALWRCRVNPWTPTKNMTDDQLKALFEDARKAMRANLKATSWSRNAVHGRANRPCPRCGTRIEIKAQGEHARMTFWCPACQPAPKR